jgi:hypothetical protein
MTEIAVLKILAQIVASGVLNNHRNSHYEKIVKIHMVT